MKIFLQQFSNEIIISIGVLTLIALGTGTVRAQSTRATDIEDPITTTSKLTVTNGHSMAGRAPDVLNMGNNPAPNGTTAGLTNICASSSLSVAPNPNNGIFYMEWIAGKDKARIELYNMLGEKIYLTGYLAPNSRLQVNISSEPAGTYMYKVILENGKTVFTGKINVE